MFRDMPAIVAVLPRHCSWSLIHCCSYRHFMQLLRTWLLLLLNVSWMLWTMCHTEYTEWERIRTVTTHRSLRTQSRDGTISKPVSHDAPPAGWDVSFFHGHFCVGPYYLISSVYAAASDRISTEWTPLISTSRVHRQPSTDRIHFSTADTGQSGRNATVNTQQPSCCWLSSIRKLSHRNFLSRIFFSSPSFGFLCFSLLFLFVPIPLCIVFLFILFLFPSTFFYHFLFFYCFLANLCGTTQKLNTKVISTTLLTSIYHYCLLIFFPLVFSALWVLWMLVLGVQLKVDSQVEFPADEDRLAVSQEQLVVGSLLQELLRQELREVWRLPAWNAVPHAEG